MTRMTTLAALSAACAALAACGGSDSDAAPPPPPAPPAAQGFAYVPPALGTTAVWSRTLSDSAGTSVSLQIRQRVTSTNDSGGVQLTFDDPTGTDVVEDGITFRTTPEVADVGPNDNTIDYTNTHVDGTQVNCVYSTPASAAAVARGLQAQALRHIEAGLWIGDTWSSTYTITCQGETPVTYTSTAAVEDVEAVTVPAGTFQSVREIVNVSYTVDGVQYAMGETFWRDPAHSLLSVKMDLTYARSDASAPYVTHDTRELLSLQ